MCSNVLLSFIYVFHRFSFLWVRQKRSIDVQYFLMTKAEFASYQSQVQMLAMQIGVRPAARAIGLDENRVLQWSRRGKWRIGNVAPTMRGALPGNQNVITPIEAVANVVQHYGDRAKISACIAGSKAMEHLADSEARELVKPGNSIAADQWTKAVDRAAGWTQARAQGIAVNVAVITPPSETERAERKAVHAQLDAITRLLSS
jgi:hypothetical protein